MAIKDLLHRSVPAVCGITEREVTLKSSKVPSAKKQLKDAGFIVVGTSEPGRTRKVWFSRHGF